MSILSAVSVAALLLSCGGSDETDSTSQLSELDGLTEAEINSAPIDYGSGRGGVSGWPKAGRAQRLGLAQGGQSIAPANGGAEAYLKGAFGPAFEWPLIPLHQALLPDGRILSYGTDLLGKQGAALHYAVWDPSLGGSSDAFMVLDNVTQTDLFCSTQLLIPATGELIMLGGDRLDAYGRRNNGNGDVTFFSFLSNSIRKDPTPMASRRWYATAVTTGDGEVVVMGGRDDAPLKVKNGWPAQSPTYAPTPEVYSPEAGWRALGNAANNAAYGATSSTWNYPRAWLAPDGHLFVLARTGKTFHLDQASAGSLTQYAAKTVSSSALPSVMYAPGKILSLRTGPIAVVFDINGAAPTITATAAPSQLRTYGNATLLPDGKVFVNGGSSTANTEAGAAYHSEIWNPQTGTWTTGAIAAKPRLYHSASILLPDGSVLTGGGGAPGPVTNLNAELYFPGYLFNPDGSGEFAARPAIMTAPSGQLGWAEDFSVEVSPESSVSRVTLVRTGSVTHAFNGEQRLLEMPFVQEGSTLHLQMPSDRSLAPPGYYLLFVFDASGVPATAPILRLYAEPPGSARPVGQIANLRNSSRPGG